VLVKRTDCRDVYYVTESATVDILVCRERLVAQTAIGIADIVVALLVCGAASLLGFVENSPYTQLAILSSVLLWKVFTLRGSKTKREFNPGFIILSGQLREITVLTKLEAVLLIEGANGIYDGTLTGIVRANQKSVVS